MDAKYNTPRTVCKAIVAVAIAAVAVAAIIGCSSLGGGSRRQNIATVIQTAYDMGGREAVSNKIESLVAEGKLTPSQAVRLHALAQLAYEGRVARRRTQRLRPPPKVDVATARSPMPAQAAAVADARTARPALSRMQRPMEGVTMTRTADNARIARLKGRPWRSRFHQGGVTAFFVYAQLRGRESSPYPIVRHITVIVQPIARGNLHKINIHKSSHTPLLFLDYYGIMCSVP